MDTPFPYLPNRKSYFVENVPRKKPPVSHRPIGREEIILNLIRMEFPLNPCLVDVVRDLFDDPGTTESLWYGFGYRLPVPLPSEQETV